MSCLMFMTGFTGTAAFISADDLMTIIGKSRDGLVYVVQKVDGNNELQICAL